MKRIKVYVNMLIVVLSVIMLSGCSYSIGSATYDSNGKIDRTYVTFDGEDSKTINLKKGEKLSLDYKVTVNKGTLSLSVTGPNKDELWSIKLDKDGADTVDIPDKGEGKYILTIKGEKTGGGCHIKINKK